MVALAQACSGVAFLPTVQSGTTRPIAQTIQVRPALPTTNFFRPKKCKFDSRPRNVDYSVSLNSRDAFEGPSQGKGLKVSLGFREAVAKCCINFVHELIRQPRN